MKKNYLLQFQQKSSNTLRSLLISSFLFLFTNSLTAQYFTKVTTGTLVETPVKTYSASWADYNNDGFDDVLIVGSIDSQSTLFTNNGDGSFTINTSNTIYNTTAAPSIACSWGDYNNDGNVDLFICNSGNSGAAQSVNFLFRNDGNGIFTRILEGDIVTDQDWSLGAAWADYDNDGFLDLYVANFMQENRLYHNNGDGTFTKITQGEIVTDNFSTYSASWVDYDNDGFQDLYVVNYFNNSLPGQNNCLYHNNGDGTFRKNTTALIANDLSASQGSSWGDFNNDGLMDLYMTVNDFADIKHNFLYKNKGNGNFEVANVTPSIDGGAAFGSAWLDMDNDGFLDLTVSNNGSSQKRLNYLYRNNGDGTFTNRTTDDVTKTPIRDFCSTVSDYNNDGYPDIFTPSQSATLINGFYKNNGGTNKWISLRLEGVISNRSAIGARIYCYADGKVQTREVSSTSGQYTGSTLVQTFGIGTATVLDRIEIIWPSGIRQVIINPALNQLYKIVEKATENGTDIINFSLPQQTGAAVINPVAHKVTLEVTNNTNLTALTPVIVVSQGATIIPASGQPVNFSNGAVAYTVVGTNGTATQIWMVTVNKAALGTSEIINTNSLVIYPNPAKSDGNVFIKSMKSGNYDLTVTNYVGQKIKNLKVSLESGRSKQVNLGLLQPGIYIISATNNTDQTSQNLIITK